MEVDGLESENIEIRYLHSEERSPVRAGQSEPDGTHVQVKGKKRTRPQVD
jgi:hypothetical protein